MTVDPFTLLAILGMAVVTYLTRISGLFLMSRVTLPRRLATALDAVPAAVLMAVITPAALATGPAETLAAAVAAIAALRLPMLAVVAVGVAAAALFRAILG